MLRENIQEVLAPKITNPGKATLDPVYSSVATIDLRRTSSIPDSAEVTEVEVSGTLSYNIGNTWMEIDNSISGSHNEARLNKGTILLFSGLRNSYEPVKAIWSIDYYTYAECQRHLQILKLQLVIDTTNTKSFLRIMNKLETITK